LYDYRAVGVATFFGSPMAGSLLMALNYRRLGRPTAATVAVVAGVVVTALIVLLAFGDDATWVRAVPIALFLGTMYTAKALQEAAVQQHVMRGGQLASRWGAFGIGLANLALMVSIIGGIVYIQNISKRVTIGTRDEVIFSGDAKKQDARALGQALKAEGYLTDRGASVLLSKGAGGTIVSFVAQPGVWDDEKSIAAYKQVAGEVASAVGGLPIKVRVVDSSRTVKREFTVFDEDVMKTLKVGAHDEVRYTGKATAQNARDLGQALKSVGYLQDRGVTVLISKDANGVVVSCVVKTGWWDDPSNVAAYEQLGRDIAPAVGGFPLRIRMVNSTLDVKKEITLR